MHSPSLEALAAAAEQAEQAGIVPGVGDPLRGRQLGRIALLKKEFGFIRQASLVLLDSSGRVCAWGVGIALLKKVLGSSARPGCVCAHPRVC